MPDGVSPTHRQKAANGWGYVLRIGDQVFYDHGVAPTWFVKIFATRKAYIYMLEILAQLVAFVTFGAKLPTAIIAFIDNTAGQAALTKGYGKDGAVNGMIAAFWSLAAHQGWLVEFERVPSKANVADAVSRDDFGRAMAEGWTRVHGPIDDVLRIFAAAAADLEYATTDAADELLNLAQGFHF